MAIPGEKAILLAIEIEKKGVHFYNELRKVFDSHSPAYHVFSTLVDEELKHKKIYEMLLNKIKVEKRKIINFTAAEIKGIQNLIEGKIFDQMEKALRYISQSLDLSQILLYALGFELDTYYFFQKLDEKIVPAEKEIIKNILKEEKSHIEKLIKMRSEYKYE